jgi:hypothetical protein
VIPVPLREIAESEATGAIAEVYAEIRAALRVPLVNLIYRHLATEAGRLEATWARLRPNLAEAETHALAAELIAAAERLRPAPLRLDAAGIPEDTVAAARAILDVYDRANALNLLAASALLDGNRGSGSARGEPAAEVSAEELLPMADPAALDEDTRTLLERMSRAAAPPGEGALTPSLYRHLASSPALLRAVWDAAGPALRSPPALQAVDVVRAEGARLAAHLPHPVDAVRGPDVRAVLERFAPAMSSMLVAGRTIRAALPD